MSKLRLSAQEGRALVMALIVLAVGTLLIPPFLAYISTNLLASRATEEGMREQYAADSGVEYALWQLQNEVFAGQKGYEINNKDVDVIWEVYIDPIYEITSTATSVVDGSSTTIVSYVELLGNLRIFNCALASQSDLWLKSGCTVTGDIYCGGELTPEDFEPSEGEVIEVELRFPSQEENEGFAERYKDEAEAGGTYEGDMTIPIGNGVDIIDLGPLYITGSLYILKDNIINLEGTIYVEGNIDVDKDSEFTGSGSIVCVGNIDLAKMADYGTEGTSVIMSLTGNITFKKEATIAALIYAPNGIVDFRKAASVTGAVIAGKIQSDKESSFILDSIYYDSLELPGYTPGGLEVKTYNINP